MNKKSIILGITGSIAVYKACELVRCWIKAGHEVNVIMTKNACEFVTPLTFQTLSRNPVIVEMFDKVDDWQPNHISLTDRAEIMVIAPASANIIAKMACGLADDALSSYALAFDKPIFVAPAMNPKMYLNPATQANLETLRSRKIEIIEPDQGELACGYSGQGRLADINKISTLIEKNLKEI